MLRVLLALRAENRPHLHDGPQQPAYEPAPQILRECCCPAGLAWRQWLLKHGLKIVGQAAQGEDAVAAKSCA